MAQKKSVKREIKKIADILVERLKAHGFHIMRYDAYSTESVYLKLDYGVAHSIRISAHEGYQHLSYKYNIFKDWRGSRFRKDDKGFWRIYFNFKEIDAAVEKMVADREFIREKYYQDYISEMQKRRIENAGKRGFWTQAVEV